MSKEELEVQRWTAKRKTAVVLEVLKKQRTAVEACRNYGLKQSDLEEWTKEFMAGGENALRSRPRDVQEQYEVKIKDLQAKVGELVLERDVLKKKAEIEAREMRS